jgi:Holliday junction resolvase RusA-like endonuclease
MHLNGSYRRRARTKHANNNYKEEKHHEVRSDNNNNKQMNRCGTSSESAVIVDSSEDEDTTPAPAPAPPKLARTPGLLKVAQTIAKKARTTRTYKKKAKEKPPPPYFFDKADLITSDPGNYLKMTIHGLPLPQRRYHFGRNFNSFDPSKVDKETFASVVQEFCNQQLACGVPRFDDSALLEVNVLFCFPREKAIGLFPDIDNLVKLLFDSLNGVLYRDDSVITKVTMEKAFVLGEKSVGSTTFEFWRKV